jgi:hypothetical protein
MIDSHLWDGGHQTSSRHCGVFNVAGATPMMRLRSDFLAAMALDLRDFELRAGILVRRRRLRQRQRQRQRSGRLADPGRPRQPRSGRASPSAFPIDAAQTAGGSPETFQGTLTLGSLDAPADAIQVQVVLDVLPAPGS